MLGCNYPRSVCVRTAPGNVNMVAYGKINSRLSPNSDPNDNVTAEIFNAYLNPNKTFYLYIIFDQRRVDIIDKVELWSP